MTNNDLRIIIQKTKDGETGNPLKAGVELNYSRMVSSSCSTSDTCGVTLVTNLV